VQGCAHTYLMADVAAAVGVRRGLALALGAVPLPAAGLHPASFRARRGRRALRSSVSAGDGAYQCHGLPAVWPPNDVSDTHLSDQEQDKARHLHLQTETEIADSD
jgi:hypothetical protein